MKPLYLVTFSRAAAFGYMSNLDETMLAEREIRIVNSPADLDDASGPDEEIVIVGIETHDRPDWREIRWAIEDARMRGMTPEQITALREGVLQARGRYRQEKGDPSADLPEEAAYARLLQP